MKRLMQYLHRYKGTYILTSQDKLVYCHEALALHAKLQDAAFRPEPEMWDEESDSDSDASLAEDDEQSEMLRLCV